MFENLFRRSMVEAIDDVCTLFSSEILSRGIYRNYFDFIWTLDRIERVTGRTRFDGLQVVDLGAGAGVVSLALARLGAQVVAADTYAEYAQEFDNQMGRQSEILARFAANGIRPILVDLDAGSPLPIRDEAAGLVLLLDVIEHLQRSPKAVLAEVARILQPRGVVIVTTPNIGWIRTRLRLAAGRTVHFPIDEWFHSKRFYGHVREYTMTELCQMLAWSGLELVHTEYGNWTHVPTRDRRNHGRWRKEFRIDSLRRAMEVGAISLAALFPSLRFHMLAAGRKPAQSSEG